MAALADRRGAEDLARRLQARRREIEGAILARVHAVQDPAEVDDPGYAIGLRIAVGIALDCALASVAGEEPRAETVPPELISQARVAARNEVSLDTVLRRYVAGHALISDFLLREAGEGDGLGGEALRRALQAEASLLDRILTAVTGAYRGEAERGYRSTEHRRATLVKRLLAGEPADSTQLGYDFDAWHLGLVAVGPDAAGEVRRLTSGLDLRLLLVRPGGEAIWGWLGGRRRMTVEEVLESRPSGLPGEVLLALGGPSPGIAGWRLTHRQAAAALPVAMRGDSRVVGYSEVAILAAVLGDDVLADSLNELYLAPLAGERDGGLALRETLRAYFAAGRNVSSAAAVLGVSRPTVTNRLRRAEERLGRTLEGCATELEAALSLHALDDPLAFATSKTLLPH